MEYIDFKKLIDALTAKPKETEWLEFKHNFHSKEEIGEESQPCRIVPICVICHLAILYSVLMIKVMMLLAPTCTANK